MCFSYEALKNKQSRRFSLIPSFLCSTGTLTAVMRSTQSQRLTSAGYNSQNTYNLIPKPEIHQDIINLVISFHYIILSKYLIIPTYYMFADTESIICRRQHSGGLLKFRQNPLGFNILVNKAVLPIMPKIIPTASNMHTLCHYSCFTTPYSNRQQYFIIICQTNKYYCRFPLFLKHDSCSYLCLRFYNIVPNLKLKAIVYRRIVMSPWSTRRME